MTTPVASDQVAEQEVVYALRYSHMDSPYFSQKIEDLTFEMALKKAKNLKHEYSWKIIRDADAVIIAHRDVTGLEAYLWARMRREQLAAANETEWIDPEAKP